MIKRILSGIVVVTLLTACLCNVVGAQSPYGTPHISRTVDTAAMIDTAGAAVNANMGWLTAGIGGVIAVVVLRVIINQNWHLLWRI